MNEIDLEDLHEDEFIPELYDDAAYQVAKQDMRADKFVKEEVLTIQPRSRFFVKDDDYDARWGDRRIS